MSASTDDNKRSKETHKDVACTGKVAFETFVQAQQVISRPQVKYRPGRSSYHCGHCGMWHIGSDKGRTGKHRANDFKERKNHDD